MKTDTNNFTRTNYLAVMQNHVQSQTWLVKAMGNPVIMGALGVVASKMQKRRR
jgi:hypothetical protein